MHRGITHQGDVRAMLRVEDKGMLHIAFIAVSVDVDEVGVMGVRCWVMGVGLSALTLLLYHTETTVEQIVIAFPFPTVLQVPLAHVGLVEETIVIHVMVA